jgi:hypothetical protein
MATVYATVCLLEQQKISDGQGEGDMEQEELSLAACESAKWHSQFRRCFSSFQKNKIYSYQMI